ncbi:hypothetical protein [Streptomyces sp. NPDC056337]|uniref:hypothetical protein n=1 Tax=Streptomyces sp. NPDC056337 TaxID=3345787 RepID=UPI0035DA291F
MSERLQARVLLLVGEEAEIVTPHSGDPERVPVDRLMRETGIARKDLAGAKLTAVVSDDGELVRFERA